MNLTPAQLSNLIAKIVEESKRNPAPVPQGIKKRLLRDLTKEIASLAYKSAIRQERFIQACRVEELKEG